MAAIVNDRDVLLQAAAVRFVMPSISPDRIPGLPGAFNDIDQLQQDVEDLGEQIDHLMNTSGSFYIRAPALAFFGAAGTTTPSTITLTAERGTGLVGGTIAWTVFAGSATISPSSGDSTVVTGSSVTGRSVTIRARLTIDSAVYDAYVTITRFGAVSAVDQINLTSQVTGSLAAGNVSGLGALALLNTVNLNTQTTGALNGLTQVTNLGNLAYANAIAANQIGAGTLAAGVIYAGLINASQVNAGIFTGLVFRTQAGGARVEISGTNNDLTVYNSSGVETVRLSPTGSGGSWTKFESPSSLPAIFAVNSSSGVGIQVSARSSPVLVLQNPYGYNTPMIRMQNTTVKPPVAALGDLCFYNGSLCFYSDGKWWRCVAEEAL